MPLILAVEPDRRQASRIAAVLRTRPRTELVIAESAATALGTLAERIPDVLLTSPLLSRQDEAALAEWMRGLGPAAAHVQALTIPILTNAAPPPARRSGVLSVLRRRKAPTTTPDGCEPSVFADQVGIYLERASAERDEVEATHASPLPPHYESECAPASEAVTEPEREFAMLPAELTIAAVAEVMAPVTPIIAPVAEIIEPVADTVEPVAAMVEPAAEIVEPAAEIIEPAAEIIEPVAAMVEPAVEVVEPVAAMVEPAAEIIELVAAMVEPAAEVVEPVAAMVEPAAAILEPVAAMVEAAAAIVEPAAAMVEPAAEVVEPVAAMVEPAAAIVEPVATIEAPVAAIASPAQELPEATVQDRPAFASRLRSVMSAWRWRPEPLPVDAIATAVKPLEQPAIEEPAVTEAFLQVVIEAIPQRSPVITSPDTERSWVAVPLEQIVDTVIAPSKPAEVARPEDNMWVLIPTQVPEMVERFAQPVQPAASIAWAPPAPAPAPQPAPQPTAAPALAAAPIAWGPPPKLAPTPEPTTQRTATIPPQPPARKKTGSKPKPRPKPVQDEWGFFDPEQCGFAALLAKLDEITDESDADHNRPETTVQIIGY